MVDSHDASFAARTRSLMTERGFTVSQLAQAAELDQSLVSRLAAASATTRREPRIEHVFALARGLGVTPGELVQGTDAASILGDWVPRAELDKEIAKHAKTRRELAAMKNEVVALKQQVASLEAVGRQTRDRLTDANQRGDDAEIARQSAEAGRRDALAECDRWHQQALLLRQTLEGMRSKRVQLERSYQGAKNSAAVGWLAALFAGIKIVTDDQAPRPRRRRKS